MENKANAGNGENYEYLLKNREKRIRLYNWLIKDFARKAIERWFDMEVFGRERIPENSSCVFVIHHYLYLEAVVLANSTDKKVHGWIRDSVFQRRRRLYTALELLPIQVCSGKSREENRNSFESFLKTKEESLFWLRNTLDAIALSNDGVIESCIDKNGEVKSLGDRDNHAGAANLCYESGVPVIPVSSYMPIEHQRELIKAKGLCGLSSWFYLERNRKIPIKICFNEPLNPGDFKDKRSLRDEIRRRQIEGYGFLEKALG